MKKLNMVLAAILAFVMQPVSAEQVVVIVNADNAQSLSEADVRNIYEENVITWGDGSKVKSYHLPTKAEARETFSQKVLGKSAKASARDIANKKITNTAKNPPQTKKSVLVTTFVGKNKDAIGYVPASAAEGKKGVRIILTIE